MEQFVTIDEAAQASGYSKRIVEHDVEKGYLRSKWIDGQRMIETGDLVYWWDVKRELSVAQHNPLRVMLDFLEDWDRI